MKYVCRIGMLALGLLLLVSFGSYGQSPIETKTVHFAAGASSATITGKIKGDQIIDYVVNAAEGQTLNVNLKTSHTALYFNILPPGSNDVAVYNSSMGENKYEGKLEHSGDYKIRVYLYRSAARRNETGNYTLTVGVTGSLGAASSDDAKVAGTPYHATGKIRYSVENAGSGMADFGVIRGSIGRAEVHISPPNMLERIFVFDGDKVTCKEEGCQIKATKDGDEWNIVVNDVEHYNIPEAIIVGG